MKLDKSDLPASVASLFDDFEADLNVGRALGGLGVEDGRNECVECGEYKVTAPIPMDGDDGLPVAGEMCADCQRDIVPDRVAKIRQQAAAETEDERLAGVEDPREATQPDRDAVECPACKGTGQIMDGNGSLPCPACDGTGAVDPDNVAAQQEEARPSAVGESIPDSVDPDAPTTADDA